MSQVQLNATLVEVKKELCKEDVFRLMEFRERKHAELVANYASLRLRYNDMLEKCGLHFCPSSIFL